VAVIKPDVEQYWAGAAGGLLAFAVVLVALGGIACGFACDERHEVGIRSMESNPFNDPVTAAILAGESRGTYKYTW
jgi:hypothetical protein